MGAAKHAMMEHEENVGGATGLLIKFGTLDSCPVHEGIVFDGDGDMETAYRRANGMINAGKIDLDGRTRREFTDDMKEAYEEHSGLEGCPICEKYARE